MILTRQHKSKISLMWTCYYCLFWLLFSFSRVKWPKKKKDGVTPATGHNVFFMGFLTFYWIFLCYLIFSMMTLIVEMRNFICTNHQHRCGPSRSMVHMHVLKHKKKKQEKKNREIYRKYLQTYKKYLYIYLYISTIPGNGRTNMHKIKFIEVLGGKWNTE